MVFSERSPEGALHHLLLHERLHASPPNLYLLKKYSSNALMVFVVLSNAALLTLS
jgi:hypothetical protein